ncbi:MAG: MoaD/ThiS family protein [Desulfobacterales bacterium]|nr:MoaD/ThiS family protein [Desulfobacterales bacterium]
MITIHIPLIHRHLSDDVETYEVEGDTVGQCLTQLVKAFPLMQEAVFTDKGELHHLVEIFVNSESAHPDELACPTEDGDEVHIITLLSGG